MQPIKDCYPLWRQSIVSIPQAVGAVATKKFFVFGLLNSAVSIPQAVGAVATKNLLLLHTCKRVSIPQAVGAVATRLQKICLHGI